MKEKTKRNRTFLKECLMLFAVFILSVVLLVSCLQIPFVQEMFQYKYRGKHPELYATAVNNVFGASGWRSNGEIVYDPQISIIETDAYGRVLFFYDEYVHWVVDEVRFERTLLIMQGAQDDKVYYYQGICCLPYVDTSGEGIEVLQYVDADTLEAFKERNDWGKPMDESKCTQSPLVKRKPEDKLDIGREEYRARLFAYDKAHGYTENEKTLYYSGRFCYADKFGRELHYVYVEFADIGPDGKRTYIGRPYAVIFEPNKKCPEDGIDGIEEILLPQDSVEQIEALKQRCQWNAPLT